jgi:hypothetical protein
MLHEISAHYTTSRLSGEPTSAREYQPVELVVQLKSNSDLSCRLILRLPAFVLPLTASFLGAVHVYRCLRPSLQAIRWPYLLD